MQMPRTLTGCFYLYLSLPFSRLTWSKMGLVFLSTVSGHVAKMCAMCLRMCAFCVDLANDVLSHEPSLLQMILNLSSLMIFLTTDLNLLFGL